MRTGAKDCALGRRDRFGPFPEELRNFLAVLDFKQFLTELQVQKADVHINHVRLVWPDGQTAVQPERIVALTASMKDARMLPPAGLHLPMPSGVSFPEGLDRLRTALEGIRVKAGA